MAKWGNRVKETTSSTGTGSIDLEGSATGFNAFLDEFNTGNEVYYLIVDDPDDPTEFEYGIGTITAGTPDTLSRDTVEGSSNSGNKVSFLSGTKTVISTPTAAALGGEGPIKSWALKNASVLAKTGDYTVVAADDGKLIVADGSGNSPVGLTLTLPTATAKFVVSVYNEGGSGNATVSGANSPADAINGPTTLAPGDAVIYWSDGTSWYAVASHLATVGQSEAEAGTATTPRYWTAERVKQAIEALAATVKTALLQNQQSQNASGDSLTAGDWRTVTLNTEVSDPDNIVALSSNQITPIAGTYRLRYHGPFNQGGGGSTAAKARVRNVTAGTTVAEGTGASITSSTRVSDIMVESGEFEANGTDAFEVQIYPGAAIAQDASNAKLNVAGINEVWGVAVLEKVG